MKSPAYEILRPLPSRRVPSLSRQPPVQPPLAEEMEPSTRSPATPALGEDVRAIPGGIIVDNPSKRVPTGFGVGFDLRTPPASEPTTSRQKVISSAGQSCRPIAEFHIITRHTGHAEKAPGLISQAFTLLGRERVVGPSCIGILSEKGQSNCVDGRSALYGRARSIATEEAQIRDAHAGCSRCYVLFLDVAATGGIFWHNPQEERHGQTAFASTAGYNFDKELVLQLK